MGSGKPLDGHIRTRMEQALGGHLPEVHIHTDTVADREARSRNLDAFAIGRNVGFAQGRYAPGTIDGDVLLAHELAHTMQQAGAREGSMQSANDADEVVANHAAAHAAHRLYGGPEVAWSRPVAHGGLRLQGCIRCCGSSEGPLGDIDEALEPDNLPATFRRLNAMSSEDLQRLRSHDQISGNARALRVLDWHAAMRESDWTQLLELHRQPGTPLHRASGADRALMRSIRDGSLSITVRDTMDTARTSESDREGATETVYGYLDSLVEGPRGFELMLRLLVSEQDVTIEVTNDPEVTADARATDVPPAGGGRSPAYLITRDSEGNQLPVARQRPDAGSGARIRINPATLHNQASIFRDESGELTLQRMQPAVVLGHELIHALHYAEGTALTRGHWADLLNQLGMPVDKAREPDTGLTAYPEELRTIWGQTRGFLPPNYRGAPISNPPWPLSFNLPPGDISETDIAAEQGVEGRRVSHSGGEYEIRRSGDPRPEALLALIASTYRVRRDDDSIGPISPALTQVILDIISSRNAWEMLVAAQNNRSLEMSLPSPTYVALHVTVVEPNEELQSEAAGLELR